MIRILQQDSRITKTLFAVIIGVAIVTMVIMLVPGISDSGAANDATVYATVRSPSFLGRLSGDSKVIKSDLIQRAAVQQLQQQGLPPMYASLILPRIQQQFVAQAVLRREADRLGLAVSNEDLLSYLKQGPYGTVFFPGGNFIGYDAYVSLIQNQAQMAVTDFEDEVKGEIELQRLESLITGGMAVSDAAVRDAYRNQGTKVKFDYAVVSAADVKKTVNPSDADLEAFFKQNAPRYATAVPETRKLELFSFDASNLPGGKSPVTDADVQAYYAAHAAEYKVDAQVQTRHILIPAAKNADAKTDAAAKAKAQDVLKQVKAGGNFAELAKKYSEDPGSKDKGGELPMIPTASLDPAYASAALALNPGQTSDVVRSQFGYHIIQTIKKDTAHSKPLSEVRDSIVPILTQQKSGAAEQTFAQQLVNEAKKNGMQKTADAHGLHLTTTDYVAKDGVIGSLADSTTVLTQAFSTAKGAAPAFASTGDGYAIFQVDDVKAAHAPAFADYKSNILNDYREQKTPELLNTQLNKLADRAKVLNDLKKAAAEMNLPLKTSDLVGKDAQVPDLGAMSGPGTPIFAMQKGAISNAINTGSNGVVLQVTDKQEPGADEIAKNFAATRERLLGTQRQEFFNIYAETLVTKYEKAGAVVLSQKKTPASSPFSKQ